MKQAGNEARKVLIPYNELADVMRIGIVVHGPEAIDTGLLQKVMKIAKEKSATVKTIMSGYTGIAAVIDAGLENLIDIDQRVVPSEALLMLDKETDVLILVNYGKNRESIIRFGEIVYSKVKDKLEKPLSQIDNGVMIEWKHAEIPIIIEIAERLGLERIEAPKISTSTKDEKWRTIRGIVPGENIWINGIVVGKAISSEVAIARNEKGRLIARGIQLKQSGVERLGTFDPFTARVRSGVVRRTKATPRSLAKKERKGIYLIDHATEDAIYSCRNARFVITVGDDTSKTAANVLYRFGVPTIAITDGDEDGICDERIFYPGSIVMRLKSGFDDLIGNELKNLIFKNSNMIDDDISLERIARVIRKLAGDSLITEERY
jgi:hypothetical protein